MNLNNYREQLKDIDGSIAIKKEELLSLEKERKTLVSKIKQAEEVIRRKEKEVALANERLREKTLIENVPTANEMKDIVSAKLVQLEPTDLKVPAPLNDDDIDEMFSNGEIDNSNIFKQSVQDSLKFGDIISTDEYRHYTMKFVGKNGDFIRTTRSDALDTEYGLTVPIQISQYFSDTVAVYKNIWEESYIQVYELPYHDATVQKYNVPKGHMYEYVYTDSHDWVLEVISLDGERSEATLKSQKQLDAEKRLKFFEKTETVTAPKVEEKVVEAPVTQTIENKTVVFNGARDKELIKLLETKYGVKVTAAVSKKTFMLVTSSEDPKGVKVDKARQLNIPICTLDDFKKNWVK